MPPYGGASDGQYHIITSSHHIITSSPIPPYGGASDVQYLQTILRTHPSV